MQVEAIRFDGNNIETICCWANQGCVNVIRHGRDKDQLEVYAREGARLANHGDWIVRGITGTFTAYRDEEFRQKHEVIK